jgi:hypothetical protein
MPVSNCLAKYLSVHWEACMTDLKTGEVWGWVGHCKGKARSAATLLWGESVSEFITWDAILHKCANLVKFTGDGKTQVLTILSQIWCLYKSQLDLILFFQVFCPCHPMEGEEELLTLWVQTCSTSLSICDGSLSNKKIVLHCVWRNCVWNPNHCRIWAFALLEAGPFCSWQGLETRSAWQHDPDLGHMVILLLPSPKYPCIFHLKTWPWYLMATNPVSWNFK